MAVEENKALVQRMYAAFGQGDIPTILNMLTDDVEWHMTGPPDIVPWAGTHRGREGVGQFFRAVGETLAVEQFEARTVVAEGETVVVVGCERSLVKATQQRYDGEWAHVFRLQHGRIAAFREF
jgi:ketosteroid isomerase-like protein